MKKPKYRIGEDVFIIITYYTYVICPCCEQTKRNREKVFRVSSARVVSICDESSPEQRYLVHPIEAYRKTVLEREIYPTRKEAQRILDR